MAANAPIGRPRRSRLYIVIGTALALLAFLAAAALASAPYLFPAAGTGLKVVVAKSNISARTRIQQSDLELQSITPTPPNSFTAISAVTGKGARVDIIAGQAVTANLLADSPDLVSNSTSTYLPIPQGYVAVTIPTSEQTGVGGYIQVGDRIAVLASISTSIFGPGPATQSVRTVFTDLVVIEVGAVTATTQSQSSLGTSLTVLMTGCNAEYLYWLLNNAQLKYELESFHDYGNLPTAPDPNCASVLKAGGVGPADVDTRWHFTRK
ncbi:MAG TPA: Flp pilus assembly protein CpaB [Candidatus Dormibacteraeota bacterium]|nr:Flp pilus assembly protein CpaB [Candidatus Dormibacteraeota bacterium]